MIEYFLHVDLIVSEANAKKYEAAASDFMAQGGFSGVVDEGLDNQLVLGLKTPESFQYSNTGYSKYRSAQFVAHDHRITGKKKVFRYVNLWRIRDLAELDLAASMNRCADNNLYRKIDSFVLREVQNFVVRVRWLAKPHAPAPNATLFRVVRQLRTPDLGTYLAAIGPLLPTLEQRGWSSLGHFQNVTGPINTVVELWSTTNRGVTAKDLATLYDGTSQESRRVFAGLGSKLRELCLERCNELPQAEVFDTFKLASYFDETESQRI